jgi:hypothetical protein
MKTRRRFRNRKGQSLILIFFVLIALAGVLALIFDYGFVLLTRRQMQTGVNSAALEGVRGEGTAAYDDNDQVLRRESARTLLRLNFDDDFDLFANATTIGAGIDSSLIQRNDNAEDELYAYTIGEKDTTLEQDMANRASFIFRPSNFQLNEANEIRGDMVVGQHVDPSDPRPLVGALHEEFFDYRRTDFRTSDEADYDHQNGDNMFLIRMRRTHNPNEDDEVPAVSSRGGPLPLLLGRLGWMNAEPADASYSIRRDGVVVRAAAISCGNPATVISPPIPSGLITGVDEISGSTPFLANVSIWGGIGTPQTFTIDDNGTDLSDQLRLAGITSLNEAISGSDTELTVTSSIGFPTIGLPFTIRIDFELLSVTAVSGTTWTVKRGMMGTIAAAHSSDALMVHHAGRSLGEDVEMWTSNRPPISTDLGSLPGKSAHRYVPIFSGINGTDRIIGFGVIQWTWLAATNELTITPLPSIVGPRGVSATGFISGLNTDDIEGLLAARATLNDLLLAPIRVRTVR